MTACLATCLGLAGPLQVGAFGDPVRDPRGWCVSVAFAALVPSTELGVKAADDAQARTLLLVPLGKLVACGCMAISWLLLLLLLLLLVWLLPAGHWCVSVAFAALVPSTELGVKAADDAQARIVPLLLRSGVAAGCLETCGLSVLQRLFLVLFLFCSCPLQAAEWFDAAQLPPLAFDHKLIVRTAFRHLAKQEAVQQRPGLPAALQAAANALEGPWQQQ